MRPHLEQGDAVGMIVASPEEDHLAVRAVLQLLPDQLNQLFLHIAALDTLSIHAGKLVLLINHVVDIVGETGGSPPGSKWCR